MWHPICNFTVWKIMADANLGQENGSILFGNVCILNTNWKMFVKLEYEKISPGEFYCLVDQNTVSLVLFDRNKLLVFISILIFHCTVQSKGWRHRMIDEILIWILLDTFMYALYVLSKYIISNNIEFAIDLLNIKSSDMVKAVKKFREFREREREKDD